ncbi:FMN-dependent NADH-azoreductase [Flavilitoribacter nigricans]|uniref:FMN dependent NADH:quinone oxidoreductase n=1 Tax=Flavilitoribacter nigricans (strain ATCC 23147 / DSM 23189 / NBRC 102662 / NCIMB 1420 / SS-2) TaxID=1122177 RepID=A0A2D0N1K6_FLAN2|nr:NAD(P)H-dependent oxidoreductase [Flavilitoribacter nigricans]PHN02256.1 ACP phosphodiesterase [Flavilitoribacter nigricans DSM 23189 = NBRC 102662]
MKILHLIASPRGEQSRTLAITREFIVALQARHQEVAVTELNLFEVELPPVHGDAVAAKYALISGQELNEKKRDSWRRIAELANDFMAFDAYVISAPMWNFTIPYVLKHYIDVIMQAGILFQFTERGPIGLAQHKRMVCICSRGSDYGPASPLNSLDYQATYLRAIFGFAGIQDISFINAQPLDLNPDLTREKLELSKAEARHLATSWGELIGNMS